MSGKWNVGLTGNLKQVSEVTGLSSQISIRLFPLLKTSLWNKQWRVWPFKGHMGAQKGHWPSCGKGWYSSGHLINAAKMKTQCFKQLEMMWITKKKHIHSVRTAQKSSAPSFAAAIWIANSTNVPHGHSCARARRITLLF